MYNPFNNIKVEIYGKSHADKIGVKLYGIEKGTPISIESIQAFVDRRKSGKNAWSTPRNEPDEVVILSGVENGFANGEMIEGVIYNTTVRKDDYENIKTVPRPSHADFASAIKDKTMRCESGGGRFSGRLTAPLCIAGGIAKDILLSRGIKVLSYVREIGDVSGDSYLTKEVTADVIENIPTELKALSSADEMEKAVLEAKSDGDSVGGRVDLMVFGLPIGVGDNLFLGLEGRISTALFGVPAVKGVEFGLGFGFCGEKGSFANDEFDTDGKKIFTTTNNSGGINGGISNGMPITVSVAIRPTPSISKTQNSVDLKTGEKVLLSVKGRHDACIVPRAQVALEASLALAILDAIIDFDKENI